MSERYSIPASDVLGENYNITTIECSDYNPNIDSSITVTITVKDVYGDAVSGESVLVTASDGNFTQLNGSNITNASSVTGTTNSSGQFTLTYSCTEWGLITFSASNKNTQIRVNGWKTVAYSTWYNLKTNGEFVELSMFGSHSVNISTSWTTALTIINDAYRPEQNVMGVGYNQTLYLIHTSGEVQIVRSGGSATTTTAVGTYYWKLK